MKDRTTIYEPHPVSPERKAQLLAQGYRILDAVHAPEGYVHPDSVPQTGAAPDAAPRARKQPK